MPLEKSPGGLKFEGLDLFEPPVHGADRECELIAPVLVRSCRSRRAADQVPQAAWEGGAIWLAKLVDTVIQWIGFKENMRDNIDFI